LAYSFHTVLLYKLHLGDAQLVSVDHEVDAVGPSINILGSWVEEDGLAAVLVDDVG
jgi:hypothetical protein